MIETARGDAWAEPSGTGRAELAVAHSVACPYPPGPRADWHAARLAIEDSRVWSTPARRTRLRREMVLGASLKALDHGLRLTGLAALGTRHALDIRVRRLTLSFADLPPALDGFTLLHMSDLHVDALPDATLAAIDQVSGRSVDLCVLTGDFQQRAHGAHGAVLPLLERLVTAIDSRHGIYGVLGNHDDAALAPALERIGIRMLLNECVTIGAAPLVLTGVDDVHHFYTEAAPAALAAAPDGFRIALVHSPELADEAAALGYRLYLTGHTHGGQICLPNGRPVYTNLLRHRDLASGLWRVGAMTGYTNSGIGVARPTVRFFSRGEVAFLTLSRRLVPTKRKKH